MTSQATPITALISHPLADDEPMRVLQVGPSTCSDSEGAVDATLLVRVGSQTIEADVTLWPDKGRPTIRRRHPLGTCGTPLEVWASDNLGHGLAEVEEGLADVEDLAPRKDSWFDRRALIGEICAHVDEAAVAAGL